jgi:15,16-dihydrobiliverdin:ferredoxin oxidoreductase
VIDFQPLHPTAEYANKYIQPLSPLKRKYPDLHGQLSGKIYDDTSFFSANMLFGRFTDESKLATVVQPAFEDYLHQYLAMADQAEPNYQSEAMQIVQQRQQAYDIYSAQKDPAVGLFDAYFGKEWSHQFVHDFLFTFSQSVTFGSTSSSSSSILKPAHTFSIDQTTGSVSVQSSVNTSKTSSASSSSSLEPVRHEIIGESSSASNSIISASARSQ